MMKKPDDLKGHEDGKQQIGDNLKNMHGQPDDVGIHRSFERPTAQANAGTGIGNEPLGGEMQPGGYPTHATAAPTILG